MLEVGDIVYFPDYIHSIRGYTLRYEGEKSVTVNKASVEGREIAEIKENGVMYFRLVGDESIWFPCSAVITEMDLVLQTIKKEIND